MGQAARAPGGRLHHPVRVLELRRQSEPLPENSLRSRSRISSRSPWPGRAKRAAGQSDGAGEDRRASWSTTSGPIPARSPIASAGTGTTPHLSGELFRLTLKLDIVHVPFSGAGPAIQALAGDHTPMAFTSLPPAIPLINEGKIRALAVAAAKRAAALPNVPTLAEAGLPDQEADTMQAVLVPAGTPRPIVDLLYREIKAIVALPDIKERFERSASSHRQYAGGFLRRSRPRSRSGARSSTAPTSRWSAAGQRSAGKAIAKPSSEVAQSEGCPNSSGPVAVLRPRRRHRLLRDFATLRAGVSRPDFGGRSSGRGSSVVGKFSVSTAALR